MNLPGVASPVLILVLGFILCFFGYRLLRFTLALAGFGAGLVFGLTVVRLIPGASQVLALVVGIVCGILGAVVATLLYKVGVFLLGAVVGLLVASIILIATGWHQPMLVRVIAAVVCGILTLVIERPLVSILSAFAGAWGIVFGVFQLFGWYHVAATAKSPPANYGYAIIAWVIVGVIGSLAQLSSNKARKHNR
jgi:hypothetical protein